MKSNKRAAARLLPRRIRERLGSNRLGLYSAALRLALPGLLLRLLWRSRKARAYRRDWGERLGLGPSIAGRPVWIHAVSVGETAAAAPLIEALLASHPAIPMLLTNTTPTGRAKAQQLFGGRVAVRYLPYDTPGAVQRFLERTAPRLGVIMETELWPNLVHTAQARNLPLILANARLSAGSARGYARIAGTTAKTLTGFHAIAAQTRCHARRFKALGAPPQSVYVMGNLKYEQSMAPAQIDAGRRLRQRLGATRPVWAAVSTHEGEETIVLEAHAQVRRQYPDAALILVPRHPERFDTVAQEAAASGMGVERRSALPVVDTPRAAVLLGDSMGELGMYLAAADLAFVGGSLVANGGHNMLEAAALALPVVTGVHTYNFAEMDQLLTRADVLSHVEDAQALALAVASLFGDTARCRRIGQAATKTVQANKGALDRLLEIVEASL